MHRSTLNAIITMAFLATCAFGIIDAALISWSQLNNPQLSPISINLWWTIAPIAYVVAFVKKQEGNTAVWVFLIAMAIGCLYGFYQIYQDWGMLNIWYWWPIAVTALFIAVIATAD